MLEVSEKGQSYHDNIITLKTSRLLSIVLVIYVYFPYFWNILENALSVPIYIEYILITIMSIFAVVLCRSISRNVAIFLSIMLMIASINILVVDYHYYALIEAGQAILLLAVPCIYISSEIFSLDDFLVIWYRFAKYNWPLLGLAIFLLKLDLVHYSIFTGICLPNIFIISYMIICGKVNSISARYINIVVMLLNLVTVAILGGRTVAFVCLVVMLISFIFGRKSTIVKKCIYVGIIIWLFILATSYYDEILIGISNILSGYDLKSRTIDMLQMQLSSGDVYLTGRKEIYSLCMSYIEDNLAMPGGFGVAMYITDGKYYMTHNILLQLLTTFGLPGTILLLVVLVVRYLNIRNIIKTEYNKLLWLMFITYFIVSLTGSSIWIHFLSTLFIALFFFGKSKLLRKA